MRSQVLNAGCARAPGGQPRIRLARILEVKKKPILETRPRPSQIEAFGFGCPRHFVEMRVIIVVEDAPHGLVSFAVPFLPPRQLDCAANECERIASDSFNRQCIDSIAFFESQEVPRLGLLALANNQYAIKTTDARLRPSESIARRTSSTRLQAADDRICVRRINRRALASNAMRRCMTLRLSQTTRSPGFQRCVQVASGSAT